MGKAKRQEKIKEGEGREELVSDTDTDPMRCLHELCRGSDALLRSSIKSYKGDIHMCVCDCMCMIITQKCRKTLCVEIKMRFGLKLL